MEKITCPYCGSKNVSKSLGWENERYFCNDCEWFFDEEDIIREDLRHKISAHLMDTDEQHPLELDVPIGENEACGLSSLELPTITGAFHDYEAIIWFNVYGLDEPIEFDTLDTCDLKNILEAIENK